MNILLIYISPNGTTEKISYKLRDCFSQQSHSVTILDIGKQANRKPEDLSPTIFEGIDLIGIGNPLFHMRITEPLETYLSVVLPRLKQPVKAFIYLTYSGITTGKAFLNLSEILKRYHIPVVGGMKVKAPHFYKFGDYPDSSAIQTVEMFCSRLSENQFQSIPWDKVTRMFSCQTWKVNLIYPFARWIGKMRQLPIQIDQSKCIQCKRCINECPTGAMEINGKVMHNSQKCIYCYHCTITCPSHAILCPIEKIEETLMVNKKIIGCENPANVIYF